MYKHYEVRPQDVRKLEGNQEWTILRNWQHWKHDTGWRLTKQNKTKPAQHRKLKRWATRTLDRIILSLESHFYILYLSFTYLTFFFLFCLCCFSKITGSSFTFVNYRLPVTLLNSNGIDSLVTCLFYKYFEHFECAYLYIKKPSRWKCQ